MSVVRLTAPPAVAPRTGTLRMGEDPSLDGAITVNDQYLERGGRPWFPVAGEHHYARSNPERWRSELAAMRAGGITLVSTYVFWNLHEHDRGVVRWDGALDLRRFILEAASVGLEVVLRIGPWVHAESRNGGFPDWVQHADADLRTDDPRYLALVEPWLRAIAEQTEGLFRTAADRTAPIVAIQVENELYDQPGHLRTLRALAERLGMTAPLWTATGWGGAELPAGEVLPVYAGYADGFWEQSDAGWPANYAMHFAFTTERDDLAVGADLRTTEAGSGSDPSTAPYATCELGGGMQVAYHRRPLVESTDVAALALAKLGSGSVFQGYYMFHGASQHPLVDARGSVVETQESQATDYPNDLPLRDYDFFAPLGTGGQRRPHADLLRQQHLLLQTAGAQLAASPTVVGSTDRVRCALRARDGAGFLFVSTYQPAASPLSAAVAQFTLELGDSSVTLPSTPVDIPAGSFFVWPVRRALPDGSRYSATAQLVTEVELDGVTWVLLSQKAGIGVELVVETSAGLSRFEMEPDVAPLVVGDTRFVVLDERVGQSVWRDGDVVVLSDDDVSFDGGLSITTTNPVARWSVLGVDGFRSFEAPGVLEGAAVEVVVVDVTRVRPYGALVEARVGGSSNRLTAPTDFGEAAVYRVTVPPLDGRAVLRVDWTGDVGRAYLGDTLIADHFWHGRVWDIDLVPHRERLAAGERIELRLLPWQPSHGVHVDPRVRPEGSEPVLEVRDVSVVRWRSVSVPSVSVQSASV